MARYFDPLAGRLKFRPLLWPAVAVVCSGTLSLVLTDLSPACASEKQIGFESKSQSGSRRVNPNAKNKSKRKPNPTGLKAEKVIVKPFTMHLVEQKGAFDYSYVPKETSPFQLKVEHTDLAYPETLQTRGRVAVVDLRADATTAISRGGIARTAMRGGTAQTAVRGGTAQVPIRDNATQTGLHGGTTQTGLRGGTPQTGLRGGTAQTALRDGSVDNPLHGGATQNQRTGIAQTPLRDGSVQNPLTGAASNTALKGGVTETPRLSTINTFQHGLTPQFHLDLISLVPNVDPDISRRLDAALDDSHHALSSHIDAMPKIPESPRAQIPQAPRLHPLMPATPPEEAPPPKNSAQKVPGISFPNLPSGPSPVDAAVDTAKKMIAALQGQLPKFPAAPGGGAGSGNAPVPPGNMPPGQPQPVKIPKQPNHPAVAIPTHSLPRERNATIPKLGSPATKIAMDVPDTRANLAIPQVNAPSITDVGAKLRHSDVSAKLAVPDTRATLAIPETRPLVAIPDVAAKRIPSIPSNTDTNAELSAQTIILWDAWHARFSKTAGAALLKAVNESDNPLGTDTVSIVVYPNHHLTVQLSKSGNPKFDAAVMQAYKSLNNSAELEFPRGSLRSQVTFYVDNKHTTDGIAASVRSKSTNGDKELLRTR